MKAIILSVVMATFLTDPVWMTNFDQAKEQATQGHKQILLNFSGSDWCAPCIKMKKDVFEQSVFQEYAANNLVLLQADFPRTKKKQLAPELKAQNEKLAELYNPEGNFPLTLLLDEQGHVLHSWEGYTGATPDEFLNELRKASHGK
jgi:thioredoxin-related protein